MELEGKKIVIPVETMYNEFELWYPYYRLKEAGAEVVVVGSGSAQEYTSKLGMPGSKSSFHVSWSRACTALS